MNRKANKTLQTALVAGVVIMTLAQPSHAATDLSLSDSPLFLTQNQAPLNLLVMGRDHKLYYEAYNDHSDLNGDGKLDVNYKPDQIDYYGYFDSHKCYTYSNGVFSPSTITADKKCSNQWSGDFLNYIATSRMDAMRKVLYGGLRSSDPSTQSSATVLERSHVPQDAHSWGKEYTSVAVDGYDISQYAPLSIPPTGKHHLFANTTLLLDSSGNVATNNPPLMRVLNDTQYRVWEWLSIERPVAGSDCVQGVNGSRVACAVAGQAAGLSAWQIVPSSAFQNLTQTTYNTIGSSVNYPTTQTQYDAMVSTFAVNAKRFGTGPASQINGSGNPFNNNPATSANPQENYLTIFQGQIIAPTAGTYKFAVDGDDAVEVSIDGTWVATFFGGHANCNCQTNSGSITLTAGTHNIVFRHQEYQGGDNYYLWWQYPQPAIPASNITDYTVRVEVCKLGSGGTPTAFLEDNCKAYGDDNNPVYKPTGLLHEFGENDSMLFGLLTGSYAKNTSGGVLRKIVSSFKNEITTSTGQFASVNGIVSTINKLKTINFGSGYQYSCGWITDRPINESECTMWGNPIGEMMYEGLRYFAGKQAATSDFSIASTGNDDATLGLPLATWDNPYANRSWCTKPFETVISDINVSFDSDKVPGSAFSTFSGDISMNAANLAQTIWDNEKGSSKQVFIGQSGTGTGSYDGAPTPKTVTSFGNIRGLSPEEPTKQGSYNAAAVAYYGRTNDINSSVQGDQKLDTFTVALASPLPRIAIPVNGKTVTMVPFAKSVGTTGGFTISSTKGQFQPTDQIVDFYVEQIVNTDANNQNSSINGGRPYGVFRINYEDVEQGADHDMDAIVKYTFQVNADNTLTVNLSSDYAAGSIIQHMGYVISGTTADGIYLEVRDVDTGTSSDPDYFLDTPPGVAPNPGNGTGWQDGQALPLTATRTFTTGTNTAAELLKDPLWYAAKWGGFLEKKTNPEHTLNNKPDVQSEWDQKPLPNGDGVPDNYFLVTNALTLKDQLRAAFVEILNRSGTASSASVNSSALNEGTRVYQAKFNSANWTGQLYSFPVSRDGNLGNAIWEASTPLNSQNPDNRNVITINDATGAAIAFSSVNDLSAAQKLLLGGLKPDNTVDTALAQKRIDFFRGKRDEEGNLFRTRLSLLGDIVNSQPASVSAPPFPYPATFDNYPAFRTANLSRTPVVYVGANDGMLHGFRADNGQEILSFIPKSVIRSLTALTDPNYSHKYYVDGSPTMADAYFDDTGTGTGAQKWRTVLVGGLNNGGQGIYALNITNPSALGTSSVLWEFTDADDGNSANGITGDPDLGFTFSQPAVVKMQNGEWAAVFGNGYNSTVADDPNTGDSIPTVGSGNAVLFVVDIETGQLIKKIDTLVGPSADPLGQNRPNGLSSVAPVDVDGDFVIDYVYAGDLFGNLWKFDMRSSTATGWTSSFKDGSLKPLPLFVATDSSGNKQPITGRPRVGAGPSNTGMMIYIGTGKYIENGDKDIPTVAANQRVQTFYGVWDKNEKLSGAEKDSNRVPSRSTASPDGSFLKQTIIAEAVKQFTDTAADGTTKTFTSTVRITSDNAFDEATHRGWFIDLLAPSGFKGERQISGSLLRNGRIVFTTLIPNTDACLADGGGWLMGLDALSGARIKDSFIDLNGDNTFDNEDKTTITVNGQQVTVAVSGLASNVGIIPTPALLANMETTEVLLPGTNEGAMMNAGDGTDTVTADFGPADFGRQSWRQLR